MSIYLQLLIASPFAVYGLLGWYVSIRWTIDDVRNGNMDASDAGILPFVFLFATFIWPVILEAEDRKRYFTRTPRSQKMIERETRRMDAEHKQELDKVVLLETSAYHRDRMRELAERRRKIEDDETEKVLNS